MGVQILFLEPGTNWVQYRHVMLDTSCSSIWSLPGKLQKYVANTKSVYRHMYWKWGRVEWDPHRHIRGQNIISIWKDEEDLGVVIQDTSSQRNIDKIFGNTFKMLLTSRYDEKTDNYNN